ncbi:MAG: class I SAM-dependent methyltransferase [Syntrophotaleaceae bacterium]
MLLPTSLIRMAPWAHALVGEVLKPGALAVDLTAGNGRDTLFLYRLVGDQGRVVAFDVQDEALQATSRLLEDEGATIACDRLMAGASCAEPGIYLIQDCHSRLADYLREPVTAMVANLGFLPGEDTAWATASPATLSALRSALALLVPGGRLAVICHVGHPGGIAEAEKVGHLFAGLPSEYWDVLQLTAANRRDAPSLLVVERRPL